MTTERIPLREPEERRAARWRGVALGYRHAMEEYKNTAELYEHTARAWRAAALLCFVVAAATLLWGLLQ